jgi:5-methylcytosine-specific restriction endonuclease McrA
MPKRTATSQWRKNRLIVLEGEQLCHWCRRAPATEADHLIEHDAGGTDDLDNLVPACKPCNGRRGAQYLNAKREHQQRQRPAMGVSPARWNDWHN